MEPPEDPERVRGKYGSLAFTRMSAAVTPTISLPTFRWCGCWRKSRRQTTNAWQSIGKDNNEDKPGLRFRPGADNEFRAASSPFGTLHNSRAGKGFFYRYGPQKLPEMLEGKDKKVTPDVVVHHAVVGRMLYGSDNYAPIFLPPDAQVLRSDGGMETLQDIYQTPRHRRLPTIKRINGTESACWTRFLHVSSIILQCSPRSYCSFSFPYGKV